MQAVGRREDLAVPQMARDNWIIRARKTRHQHPPDAPYAAHSPFPPPPPFPIPIPSLPPRSITVSQAYSSTESGSRVDAALRGHLEVRALGVRGDGLLARAVLGAVVVELDPDRGGRVVIPGSLRPGHGHAEDKVAFLVQNLNTGASFDLGADACALRLQTEINGYNGGGQSDASGWRFKPEPNNGIC
ncbi:Uu.00g082600.m01.CDS01 [Anthostomella pinea]|uniref:Uu.00g082600.m01.CDS01 n=1 Tax=Anthostomella pinea TaxID=933095 RepID=A0AAI8VLE5_9PEZI|nr:Uu.00g082600.m01.CDS01 [Anthostomella pinea]